jgi:hypothetical protein
VPPPAAIVITAEVPLWHISLQWESHHLVHSVGEYIGGGGRLVNRDRLHRIKWTCGFESLMVSLVLGFLKYYL